MKSTSNNVSFITAIKSFREKYLPYNEKTIRRLAISLSIMLVWILIWALVFKLCIRDDLIRNYYNLKNMTLQERIMWDIIPFRYHGEGVYKSLQIMSTVLNCFVLAPFGVTLNYIFEKNNLLRNVAICFCFSLFIETLQAFTSFANPATEDLITNTFGYFIGYFVYRLLFKRLSVKQSVWVFALFNIICAALFVYSVATAVINAPLILKLIMRTF